jgi:hypothetical protein
MKRAFPRAAYNQRWQVESAISRYKRLLGPFLPSHSRPAQKIKSRLRALTHNLILLSPPDQPIVSTEHQSSLVGK